MNPIRNGIVAILLMAACFSCQKETSFERSKEIGHGSLRSDISGECLPKTVEGVFLTGKVLSASNLLQVDIDVSSIGSYKISTDTVNGYYFEAGGSFSSAGINTVNFMGKGTPVSTGTNIFTIHFDSTVCVIEVTVSPANGGSPAVFVLQGSPNSCMNAAVMGNYGKDVALNSSNKVDIEVNVTNIGTYNISTVATDGMTFASTGTFTATGAQRITLNGSGTPLNTGLFAIPITVGGSSCSFPLTVNASSTSLPTSTYFWKFTEAGFGYQGAVSIADAQLVISATPVGTLSILTFTGTTSTGDTVVNIVLTDFGGGINKNEVYTTSSSITNPAVVLVNDFGGVLYEASPSTAGANISVKITNLNAAAKTVEGTFTGTAKSGSGVIKTITAGQFKVQYQ